MFPKTVDFLRDSRANGQVEHDARRLTSLELCAGGGGQALGLEAAGFRHVGLIEADSYACATLAANSEKHELGWNVIKSDVRQFNGLLFRNTVDLLSGGLPCPPFSRAGKQLGERDERNLWNDALRLVAEVQPKAVMLENVRGILDPIFDTFRSSVMGTLERHGYVAEWNLLAASDFGISQLRPRAFLVALKSDFWVRWSWPLPSVERPLSVGDVLMDLMRENGWTGASAWRERASEISPTIVGGSLRHGGPDLGPTRARRKWLSLGVDGCGIAEEAPSKFFIGLPRLTLRMVARLQGFPEDWIFAGGKTASYRQIGNALPPSLARAVGCRIRAALALPSFIQDAPSAATIRLVKISPLVLPVVRTQVPRL